MAASNTPASDPYDLARFVSAQQPVYAQVRAELSDGRKRSHWMWFIFPQLKGLGSSSLARAYALASPEEARAYLAHPLLGARLRECAALLLQGEGEDAREVMGYPNDLKLRSSMTLFAAAAAAESDRHLFQGVLARFFAGVADPLTRELLTSASRTSG
jgi:uncharacterized protein (DUF1810 family)